MRKMKILRMSRLNIQNPAKARLLRPSHWDKGCESDLHLGRTPSAIMEPLCPKMSILDRISAHQIILTTLEPKYVILKNNPK